MLEPSRLELLCLDLQLDWSPDGWSAHRGTGGCLVLKEEVKCEMDRELNPLKRTVTML